jgi:hypothetical protein
VFGELQDVRKQLFSALNPQSTDATSSAGATSSSSAVNDLFSKIDTDGNGSIDKNELQTFLNTFSSQMYGQNGSSTPNALYSSTVNISA